MATVAGRYVLGEEFGAGGMASVHLGLARGEGGFSRTVAIKRLHAAMAHDPELSTALMDEARVTARIHHPNVVPTVDVVADEGQLFIVMDYVHGESLAHLIKAMKSTATPTSIPLPVVAAIFVDVLQGLHAAHEATNDEGASLDVVHRDVSPQNILVGADGVTRVFDFGIAKSAGRSQVTRQGLLKGKLGYMAPEQLKETVARTTDVYAAGVCLWEAVTMRRLFASDNGSLVLAKVAAGLVDPPSKYVPGLPPALEAVILRALHRDPAQRFPTAREMVRALSAATEIAAPHVVGDWVESIAGAGLAARAVLIAKMEEAGLAERMSAPPTTAPSVKPPSRRSISRTWLALAGAAGLVAVSLVASMTLRRASGTASASEAATDSLPSPPAETSNVSSAEATEVTAAAPPLSPIAPTVKPHVTHTRACSPPYTVDAAGVRRYRKECLR
jgi:serine/threonine-protein kinase